MRARLGPSGSLFAGLQIRLKVRSTSSGLKSYKPVTPGLRGRIITSRKDLWAGGPFKPLVQGLPRKGGRNAAGVVTARHRGGGSRRLYREVDFTRGAHTPAGTVERLEYDPIRSARVALLRYDTAAPGERTERSHSYVLAPQGIKAGDRMACGAGRADRPRLTPGRGGQLARSAGTAATIAKKGDDGYALVRLPSGEQRLVSLRCTATIGTLSNPQHKNIKVGKAGGNRWKGRRPRVRGMAMNSVDHPHGGGRGKKKGRISQTPWGVPTKGYRTRKNERTDWVIVTSRHKLR
ncbi:hypothetical protein QBZ16_002030 [Prototheca wickerhamii]|uniref:Uncharacterized protein n=1 Tax=Prototheca wickerhamii TaxID=3111 RepID=A0AAD9MLF3_PROWI|nr:hypothetical protein QBZ16_002030 [Prototheca wickerhamii]